MGLSKRFWSSRGAGRHRLGLAGRALLGAIVLGLATAGLAWAVQALPPGGQVNDDLGAGLNKALGVNGENPTNADVVGGALTAGKVAVP
jgi:hypothetical protein